MEHIDSKKNKIVVLLSSYNGEKYLEEQLRSLINQEGVETDIIVRDDGSSDGTQDILSRYQNEGAVRWYGGTNLRPAKSFWDLIESAPEANYYAFSDQDDYWMPDKLSVAVEALRAFDGLPAMYCSAYQMTDEYLTPIPTPMKLPCIDIYHALMENVATGCTVVFNQDLMKIIRAYRPDYYFMHDEWIYKVCVAIGGKVIYDQQPHILYRQHASNVIGGIKDNWFKRVASRFSKVLKKSTHHRYNTVVEIMNGYADFLPEENRLLVEKCLCSKSFPYNLLLAFDFNFYKQASIGQALKMFFLFLLKKF